MLLGYVESVRMVLWITFSEVICHLSSGLFDRVCGIFSNF